MISLDMKHLVRRYVLAIALASPVAVAAQFEAPATLPQPSATASLTHVIGITDVKVTYASPSLRGRTAFGPGAVVAFDEVWRAGANANTLVSFQHGVQVAGKPIAAGIYSLYLIPRQTGTWTVILNKFTNGWGEDSYSESDDALRVEVAPLSVQESWENLTFLVADRSEDRANLVLGWGTVRLPIPISVDLQATVLADLKSQMRSLPQYSWLGSWQIANYLATKGWDPAFTNQTLDKSISINANTVNLGLKSRLLAKEGKTAEAEQFHQRAIAAANTLQDYAGYLNGLLVEQKGAQAQQVVTAALKKFPDSYRPLAWQAQVYNLPGGDKKKALEFATKAVAKAPDAAIKTRMEALLKQIQG